jgi:hypothetical protein
MDSIKPRKRGKESPKTHIKSMENTAPNPLGLKRKQF